VRELILKADPWIFPKPEGGRMDDDCFRDRVFYPLLAALNIQPIPDKEHPATLVPYSCRHTFANLMKDVTGSDTDKSALMGHTDITMTRYYQSSDITSIQRITDAL
jgi:integrase